MAAAPLHASRGLSRWPPSVPYLHRRELTAWALGLGLPADTARADLFEAAKATSKGNRPICGIRLQQGSLAFFCDQLALEKPDHDKDQSRSTAIFGRTAFIYLNRTDKVEQAVSLVRAEQSGLWHRNADGSDLEAHRHPARPELRRRSHQKPRTRKPDPNGSKLGGLVCRKAGFPSLASRDLLGSRVRCHRGRARYFIRRLGLPTAPAQALSARTAQACRSRTNADWIARFRAQTR